MAQLADSLSCSQSQVQDALFLLQTTTPSTVVRLHPKTRKNDAHNNHVPQQQEPARYGLWNVELRRQLDTALLAALAEACPNYASSLPAMAELVGWVRERLPRSLVDDNGNHNDRRTHAALDHYIQQAVAPLYEMPSSDDNGHDDGHDDNDKTRKNLELVTGGGGHVVQVARLAMEAVFHRHCQRGAMAGSCTTQGWKQVDLLEQWKMELPGEGYPPSLTPRGLDGQHQKQEDPFVVYLQGLAVRVIAANGNVVRPGLEERPHSPERAQGVVTGSEPQDSAVVALHCIVVRWNERWILCRDGCCLGCCGCVRLMLCWIVVMLSFVVQRLRCIVGILIHLVVLSCSFLV